MRTSLLQLGLGALVAACAAQGVEPEIPAAVDTAIDVFCPGTFVPPAIYAASVVSPSVISVPTR